MRKLTNDELGRLTVEEYRRAAKMPVAIVLDNVRSANNVGSVFRTADCLGAERLCLCGIVATPPNKDINKTALGATESVEWKHFASTLDAVAELRAEGYTILSVEQAEGSIALQDFVPAVGQKYALICRRQRRLHRDSAGRHQALVQHIGERRDCALGSVQEIQV